MKRRIILIILNSWRAIPLQKINYCCMTILCCQMQRIGTIQIFCINKIGCYTFIIGIVGVN